MNVQDFYKKWITTRPNVNVGFKDEKTEAYHNYKISIQFTMDQMRKTVDADIWKHQLYNLGNGNSPMNPAIILIIFFNGFIAGAVIMYVLLRHSIRERWGEK